MSDLKMPDINNLLIAGNLTSDPIYRKTSNGTPVVNFYITSNRTEWHVWSTGNGNMFSKRKGEINVPKTYEIIKEDPDRPQPLDNFL